VHHPKDVKRSPLASSSIGMVSMATAGCSERVPMSVTILNDRGLNRAEVAEKLGVHPLTVERRTSRGEIPSYKIGRARRWRLSAICEYVARLEQAEEERRKVDKAVNRTEAPPATKAA
jgi:excisionase family DNA binding protein